MSPQVFVCHLPWINYIPVLFYGHHTMAEYTFFLQKADWWRKDMALMWGDISIFPLLPWFQLSCHSQAELSSMNGLKAWGRDKNSATTLPFCWYWQRRRLWGTGIMACWPCGWILVRPGSPPWMKRLGNWLPVPPTDPIGLTPWCSYTRAPAMCHSLRRSTWASYLREGQRWLPAGGSAN